MLRSREAGGVVYDVTISFPHALCLILDAVDRAGHLLAFVTLGGEQTCNAGLQDPGCSLPSP